MTEFVHFLGWAIASFGAALTALSAFAFARLHDPLARSHALAALCGLGLSLGVAGAALVAAFTAAFGPLLALAVAAYGLGPCLAYLANAALRARGHTPDERRTSGSRR